MSRYVRHCRASVALPRSLRGLDWVRCVQKARVVVAVAACLVASVVLLSCASGDTAFRRAAGEVVRDAIALKSRLAFDGPNYDDDARIAEAITQADTILAAYFERVNALPQPDSKALRYLRIRLLVHGKLARERHESMARYLGTYLIREPGAYERIADALRASLRCDSALVESTALLAASEKIALGTNAVGDWVEALGSEALFGQDPGVITHRDSAAARAGRVRREINAVP